MVAKTSNPNVGDVFERLTVSGEPFRKGTNLMVPVTCVCGNQINVYKCNLVKGASKSCGCLNAELTKSRSQKYPDGSRETYMIWYAMMHRCYNENDASYINYGGRGVTVAKRWHNFLNFWEDMGRAPKRLTLERVRNNRGYSKSNCIWAPWSANAANKRIWHRLVYLGQERTVLTIARRLGVPWRVLYQRVVLDGLSLEQFMKEAA